ncbi:MAG: hypothetical protein P4L53_04840 [Candidatus Obscuribacterales bacterium]|nr:hypothetical protein [Candidatus Obscuribacterales bacterium]
MAEGFDVPGVDVDRLERIQSRIASITFGDRFVPPLSECVAPSRVTMWRRLAVCADRIDAAVMLIHSHEHHSSDEHPAHHTQTKSQASEKPIRVLTTEDQQDAAGKARQ